MYRNYNLSFNLNGPNGDGNGKKRSDDNDNNNNNNNNNKKKKNDDGNGERSGGVVVSHSVLLNNHACKKPWIQARGERNAAVTEKKRRMQMGDSLLKLKSLLPNTLKMDKCMILREAEIYIASLRDKIDNLNQKKKNLAEQIAPQERNLLKYEKGKNAKVEEEEYEGEGENTIDKRYSPLQDQIWVEQIHDTKDIFITCSSSLSPSLSPSSSCSSPFSISSISSSSSSSYSSSSSSYGSSLKMCGKRRLIMSRIFSILDKANIEVMNANGAWQEDGISHFMLHGKIQGGSELSPVLLKDQLSRAFVYNYM